MDLFCLVRKHTKEVKYRCRLVFEETNEACLWVSFSHDSFPRLFWVVARVVDQVANHGHVDRRTEVEKPLSRGVVPVAQCTDKETNVLLVTSQAPLLT